MRFGILKTIITSPATSARTSWRIINLFYSSITNSSYYSNSQFKNKFIPTPWVRSNVTRNGDGG